MDDTAAVAFIRFLAVTAGLFALLISSYLIHRKVKSAATSPGGPNRRIRWFGYGLAVLAFPAAFFFATIVGAATIGTVLGLLIGTHVPINVALYAGALMVTLVTTLLTFASGWLGISLTRLGAGSRARGVT